MLYGFSGVIQEVCGWKAGGEVSSRWELGIAWPGVWILDFLLFSTPRTGVRETTWI